MKQWFQQRSGETPMLIVMGMALFFFLYSINFTFMPTYTSRLIAVAAILYGGFQFARHQHMKLAVDRGMTGLMAVWFLLFFWVSWRTMATDFQDPSWLVNTVFLLIQVAVGSLFFAWWFFKEGYSFRFLVRMIQICIVVQAGFIIFYFFSWEFKELTIRFIPEGGNIPALHPYRSRGLTHQASASLSAFQATGLLMTAYLILKAKSWKEMIPDLISACLLVGSIFLTGRSGFLMLPVVVTYVVLHVVVTRRIGKRFTTWLVALPIVLVTAFLTMELVYTQLGGWAAPWGGGDAFRSMTRWTFDEYGSLVTEGRSRTTDVLIQEHWFFPDEPKLLFLGDPRTYEFQRVDSDIGIVRRIFGIGIIGSVLTWLLVMGLLGRSINRAFAPSEKILILLFGGWIFLMEFKEPFITDFRFAGVYLLFFFYLCVMPIQPAVRMRVEPPGEEGGLPDDGPESGVVEPTL